MTIGPDFVQRDLTGARSVTMLCLEAICGAAAAGFEIDNGDAYLVQDSSRWGELSSFLFRDFHQEHLLA